MGSEVLTHFESPVFIDCTGDGLIGHLAGAKYRVGREARREYDEEWAPPEEDGELLGSTILFYTKDVGHPERFVPPSITKDIASTPIPEHRIISTGSNGCAYWWIEYGGLLDTVDDNEHIRDELWSVIYGIWDYIKNSGRFDADNLTLEWVGSIPGKREYRRFLGDYVLTQGDIMSQKEFTDAVAFGGWSIDLHPPEGVYAPDPGCKNLFSDGVYQIPFRSLYSVNVENMLMAGRDISASHVAFGSTRVMATCAVIGEAAGTAAALCWREKLSPRELAESRSHALQQELLLRDASMIGVRYRDPRDLAAQSTVTASSYLTILGQEPDDDTELFSLAERDVAIVFPVDPALEYVELLVQSDVTARLEAELWSTERPQNYLPYRQLCTAQVAVEAGKRHWAQFGLANKELANKELAGRNAFLVLRRNAAVRLGLSTERPYGALALLGTRPPADGDPDVQPLRQWDVKALRRRSFCFRVAPGTLAYSPVKAVDGVQRPYGGPHLWSSEKSLPDEEQYVELTWARRVRVRTVSLIFNDDVDEDLINLHHHRSPFPVVPELVRDYRVEALIGGGWQTVARAQDNRRRHRAHELPGDVETNSLRVVVEQAHGSELAQIVSVRVFEEAFGSTAW